MNFDSYIFFGNTSQQYAVACFAFAITLAVLKLVQFLLLQRIKRVTDRTKMDIDDALIKLCAGINPLFYLVISLYVGGQFLTLTDTVSSWINIIVGTIVIFSIVGSVSKFIDYLIKKSVTRTQEDDDNLAHTNAIVRIIKMAVMLAIWVVVILLILSNLGIDITSAVAGLGIGGIAVALAVQNILSDVFSSFSLLIDRPFEVGDEILIGTDRGVVQKIGLKTTRIKTDRGEELIVSNQELTTIRVQNFRRLEQRKEKLRFTVVYGLTQTTLKKIPRMMKGIIEKVDGVAFQHCYLCELGDSGVVFETSYIVDSPSKKVYLSKKHQINLAVYTQLMKEQIELAYPSQTLYVEKLSE